MFRNLLFDVLGLQGTPETYTFAWQEIVVAIVGAGIFMGLMPVFTRIYFAMNKNGAPSRVGGWLTSIALAVVWAGITLDVLGFFSTIIFLIAGFVILMSVFIYEIVAK